MRRSQKFRDIEAGQGASAGPLPKQVFAESALTDAGFHDRLPRRLVRHGALERPINLLLNWRACLLGQPIKQNTADRWREREQLPLRALSLARQRRIPIRKQGIDFVDKRGERQRRRIAVFDVHTTTAVLPNVAGNKIRRAVGIVSSGLGDAEGSYQLSDIREDHVTRRDLRDRLPMVRGIATPGVL